MKWMRLKTFLIPAIMQEVDSVTEHYLSKNNLFKIKDLINDFKNTKNKDNLTELITLRESITERVEDIDNFYEDNIGDPRVVHFEKARIRLKKLLMYDPDVINKLENDNNNFRGLAYDYHDEFINTTSDKQYNNTNNYITDNNKTLNNSPKKQFKNNIQTDRTNNISAKQKSENNNVNNNLKTPTKIITKKIEIKEKAIEINLDPTENKNQLFDEIIKKNLSNSTIKEEAEESSNWKEIVFKIKLTEHEYKILLREKSNLMITKK